MTDADRQARLRQVVRETKGCQYTERWAGQAWDHVYAIRHVDECDACLDLLIAGIRGTTGGDRPVSLDNVIDALGKAIRVRGGDER